MIAYIVLLLALASRILPPMLHLTALNFTAVGGSLLFFGAKRSRSQIGLAVLAFAATDIFLTTSVYHYSFHVRGYLITWAWYAAVCLLGGGLLRRVTTLRVGASVLASSTSFFLLSNFVVWLGAMYPHTGAGLLTSYGAALPFFRNDLISTGLVASALFGIPVLASRLAEAVVPGPDTI